MTALLVAAGAAVGAPARYLLDRAIQSRHRAAFPWGTFVVNMLASVVLGFVTGAVVAEGAGRNVEALVGIGLCGTLSTYSTFAFETLRLVEEGSRRTAVANVVCSVVGGLGAAFLGAFSARAIWA
jgi:CrcB protein